MPISVNANEGYIVHWFVDIRHQEHEWTTNVFILAVQAELRNKNRLICRNMAEFTGTKEKLVALDPNLSSQAVSELLILTLHGKGL